MSSDEAGNRHSCAACKHQRKRCGEGCVFRRHFPTSRKDQFEAVHKIFGLSNLGKMIRHLNSAQQDAAVNSVIWEAMMWKNDPVHGPLGFFRRLDQEREQLVINQHMLLLLQQQQQQQQQQQPPWDTGIHQNFVHDNGQLPLDPSVITINNFNYSVLQGQESNIAPSFVQEQERQNNGAVYNHTLVQGRQDQRGSTAALYVSNGIGRGRPGQFYDQVHGHGQGQESHANSGVTILPGREQRVIVGPVAGEELHTSFQDQNDIDPANYSYQPHLVRNNHVPEQAKEEYEGVGSS